MSRKSRWTSMVKAIFSTRHHHASWRRMRQQQSLHFERLENKALLAADLTLDISDGAVSVEEGGTVIYLFEYANVGDSAATDAMLHTTVPAHTSFAADAGDPRWKCTETIGRFSWSRDTCSLELGEVAPETNGIVEFAVTVDTDLSSRVRQISNIGFISGDADRRHRNDFGSAVTPVIRQLHDLQIDVSDGDTEVKPGGTIVYTLNYSNGGIVDAPGTSISMNLPSHTTYSAESSSDGWTCDDGRCSLRIGNVPPEGSGTITIGAVLDGDVSTRVRRLHASALIADDGSGAADRNRRNNFDAERTSVVHLLPDVSIAIDDGDAGVAPGETIIYNVDYANEGLFDATGVTISMDVPRHTTFNADASTTGWTCVEQVCTQVVGNLAAESTGTTTFAVTVDAEVSTGVRRIYASASIVDDGTAGVDANRRNNRAFERISIRHALPDVSLRIDDGDIPVAPGASILYTLQYTNDGTLDAGGAELHVRIPRHVAFTTEGSSEGWTCADGNCTLSVGDIAAGESGTATLAVTVDADLSRRTRRIYALASISDDGMNGRDANRWNNFAFARTSVVRA